MDGRAFIQRLRAKKDKLFWAALIWRLLAMLELIHYLLLRLREIFYGFKLKKRREVNTPVISVGNITAGGTGKTPLVIYLAERLLARGFKPAVLSRGYGSSLKGPVVVSEGDGPLLKQGEVGDELFLLARLLSGVPLILGCDRYRAALLAEESFSPDLILLDDAFQHWQLERQLDLVVIDASHPFGGGNLLPRGFLREPLSSLSRAGAFILSRSDQVSGERLGEIKEKIRLYNSETPIYTSRHLPSLLYRLGSSSKEQQYSPDYLSGRELLAFCGLGNPDSFRHTLEDLGAEVMEFVSFPDHHRYQKQDLQMLEERAKGLGVRLILTTEKDAVKLTDLKQAQDLKWMVLGIEMELEEGEKVLEIFS